MRLTIVRFLRQATTGYVSNRENSIMVKNLSWLSSPMEVKEFFSKYGQVKHVFLPFDEKQGIYCGYGFVEFENQSSVQDAFADDYHRPQLDGNYLKIAKRHIKKEE
uniref:RRM domain-containing protein n=1 Tax=Panagrolaimus superbus TaxID=310955 RepID=A0A914YM49_9BILA